MRARAPAQAKALIATLPWDDDAKILWANVHATEGNWEVFRLADLTGEGTGDETFLTRLLEVAPLMERGNPGYAAVLWRDIATQFAKQGMQVEAMRAAMHQHELILQLIRNNQLFYGESLSMLFGLWPPLDTINRLNLLMLAFASYVDVPIPDELLDSIEAIDHPVLGLPAAFLLQWYRPKRNPQTRDLAAAVAGSTSEAETRLLASMLLGHAEEVLSVPDMPSSEFTRAAHTLSVGLSLRGSEPLTKTLLVRLRRRLAFVSHAMSRTAFVHQQLQDALTIMDETPKLGANHCERAHVWCDATSIGAHEQFGLGNDALIATLQNFDRIYYADQKNSVVKIAIAKLRSVQA